MSQTTDANDEHLVARLDLSGVDDSIIRRSPRVRGDGGDFVGYVVGL